MLPKNRRNASSIWSMMTKIGPGLARCNVCGQEFRSNKGTSNMLRHVKSKHSIISDKVFSELSGDDEQSGVSTSGHQPPSPSSGHQTAASSFKSVTRYGPDSDKEKVVDQMQHTDTYKHNLCGKILPANRKNASSIWNIMTKIGPGLARCNMCGQEFKSDKGTSNILRHVKLKHFIFSDNKVFYELSGDEQSGASTSSHQPLSSGQQTTASSFESVTKCGPESDKKILDHKLHTGTHNSLHNRYGKILPKKKKHVSSIWTMMTRIDPGLAKCNLCGKEFKCDKGTSNMLRHVKLKHSNSISSDNKVFCGLSRNDGQSGASTSGRQPVLSRSSFKSIRKYRPESDKEKVLDQKLHYAYDFLHNRYGKMMSKNRKNASRIWNIMTKIGPGSATCNICGREFRCGNGTSNLRKHLRSKHGNDYKLFCELSGDDGQYQLSGDGGQCDLSEDDGPCALSGDGGQCDLSGDDEQCKLLGDDGQSDFSGDDGPCALSGDDGQGDGQGELSGDGEQCELLGDNGQINLSGDDRPCDLSGDDGQFHLSEDDGQGELSGDDGQHELSGRQPLSSGHQTTSKNVANFWPESDRNEVKDRELHYTYNSLHNRYGSSNRRKASSIWNVMTRIGSGLARCNMCGQEFRCETGTSNMLKHVKSKHGSDYNVFCELPGDGGQSGASSSGYQPVLSGQQATASSFGSVITYGPEAYKKKALDQKLLKLVFRDMQPFSIVDDTGFQDFCKEMDPRYELPSKRQLKGSLSAVYAEEKGGLIETLSKVESVAITTDSWTCINMESFLTVFAHFLEPLPSWKLQCVVLATRPLAKDYKDSSAGEMAEIINELLEEFGLKDKLVSATTDNAPAMVSLVENHFNVLHVRCFADTLNLIVKDFIKASSELEPLIEAVKKIVNFFYRSAKATAKLKTTIDDLGLTQQKLCQGVGTRWNATLKMLRRYHELHRPVSCALMALGKGELIISDQNLEDIQQFSECLEPFEEAAEMMSTEPTTSLSKVLVVVSQLQHFLENEATKCQLTDVLIRSLSDRFPNPEDDFSGAAATLLDPRFKRVPFTDDQLRISHEETIIAMMRSLSSTDTGSSNEEGRTPEVETLPPAKKQKRFMQNFRDTVIKLEEASPQTLTGPKAEFQRYMEMKFLDMEEDPLQWWQEHSPLFPQLSTIARKVLFIPATSAPSDRLFSKAGELVSRKRSCLSESNVDMILFLNKVGK